MVDMGWSGLGPAVGAIGSLFGNTVDPAKEAMKYVKEIYPTVSPYYQPYIQTGQRTLPMLESKYAQLLSDPNSVMAMLGAGFQQSPGYNFNYRQNMNAVNQAAAAGGMVGTQAHQQQAGEMASQLANQDFYNYLGNVRSLYDTGLSGMGGLNNMGFQASQGLADILAQSLLQQAQLSAQSAMYKNQQSGGIIGGIAKSIGF